MARVRQTENGVGYPTGDGIWDKRKNGMRLRFFLGTDPVTKKKVFSRGVFVPVATQYTRSGKHLNDVAKNAVEKLRAELIKEYEARSVNRDASLDKLTVAEYADRWCTRREMSDDIKGSTNNRYEAPVARAKHYFGSYTFSEIKVRLIREKYAQAREHDGVTPNQLARMHFALCMIFDEAQCDDLIIANPFRNKTIKVSIPKSNKRKSLSESRANELLSIRCDPNESRFIGVIIAIKTGLRRGEVLGLQWKHVHFGDNPYIEVAQQLRDKRNHYEDPKANSFRVLTIDHGLAELLLDWKSRQAELMTETASARLEMRQHRDQKLADARFNDYPLLQTEETTVITDTLGEPMNPGNFGRWFRYFCCRNGFGKMVDEEGNEVVQHFNENGVSVDENGRPYSRSNPKPKLKLHYEGLKFHELRHTNISLQLSHNVDVVTVQTRAGHKRLTTTDLYAHPVPENDQRAAMVIGETFAVPESGAA